MKVNTQRVSALVALCMFLNPIHEPVLAQQSRPRPAAQTIGASNGQVAGVIAGIAGAGILIGVLVTVAAKHNHALTGCARSGAEGIQLTTEPDKATYALIGDVSGVKPGDRVRVAGKKAKAKSPQTRQFLVEKVSKDFGPCEVASSSR